MKIIFALGIPKINTSCTNCISFLQTDGFSLIRTKKLWIARSGRRNVEMVIASITKTFFKTYYDIDIERYLLRPSPFGENQAALTTRQAYSYEREINALDPDDPEFQQKIQYAFETYILSNQKIFHTIGQKFTKEERLELLPLESPHIDQPSAFEQDICS